MISRVLLLATLASSILAQTTVVTSSATATMSTASQEMPAVATQGFNANLVNNTVRLTWCQGQQNTCPEICGGRVSENTCVEASTAINRVDCTYLTMIQQTLTYSCVCSNGTVPDCTAYRTTLPFFICQATYDQCIANNPNDATAQQTCKDNEQCGNLTARSLGASASSSSSPSSTGESGSQTGSSSASAASSTNTNGAISVPVVSNGAFLALLSALCALVL